MPVVAPRVAGQAERSSSALEDRSEGGARRPRAGHRWWPVSARSSRLSARQEVGPLPPSRICLRPVPATVAVHRHPSPALGLFWNPTFSHGVSLPFHPAPCESVGIADSAHGLRGFSKATATAETLELVTRSRSRLRLRRRRCLATLVPSV